MKFLAVLLYSFFFMTTLHADESSPIKIETQVDKNEITIGDPIELRLVLKYDNDIHVVELSDLDNKPFEILNESEKTSQKGKQTILNKYWRITVFQVGEFELPAFSVRYRLNNEPVQSLQSQAIPIQVISVAGEGDEFKDIRDIKGVRDLKSPFTKKHAAYSGGILILALIGYILMARLRSQKQQAVVEKYVSPEERAFQNLHSLYDSELLKKGLYRQYFFKLTEVLKVYIEQRFHMPAQESTTDEILKAMRSRDIPEEISSRIKNVFETADLAKFAKFRPSPIEIKAIHNESEEIVKTSLKIMKEKEKSGV